MDDGYTEHSGCPVLEGEKWITVVWMRDGVRTTIIANNIVCMYVLSMMTTYRWTTSTPGLCTILTESRC